MSQSPPPAAGPSNHASRTDANLLRQFVMEYLQLHGFDKALAMFQAGIADHGTGTDDKDGDGEDEPIFLRRGSGQAGNREAIFRAPGPVPIESTLKRNIPQAQSVSASTMSERLTPEFEAQAKYIIEQLQKKVETQGTQEIEDAPAGESLLDPSDRTQGYRRYRRWVDGGLDLWKPELDALCFPVFAHTFLDLLSFGFKRSAREFYDANRAHHEDQHPQELSTLAAISDRQHISINPYCLRMRSQKYVIPMSRNPHSLLLQWLSGAGLDEEWEAGLHSSAGRAKEAVKAIVTSRLTLAVSKSTMPLDKIAIASSSGLMSSLIRTSSIDSFNSSTLLKLGAAPVSEKLREQVIRTINDHEDGINGDASPVKTPSVPNGHDVDRTPEPIELKLEAEAEPECDLISPDESETNPPAPAVFRIADLKREVEAVRDKRKMIRLGARLEEGKAGPSSAFLPSIVAFTVFDGGEGLASVEFSQDSSLMAAGSSESCVRLWSLKGEKLKGKSVDPLDGSIVEDDGFATRRLIGHSGPVYSLSFDPICGSASPPQGLLSSSQDGTVRLWSLDTYSNLVVYRGHNRDAVWDVEWGPMGVYFATASRDRTARLWCSEKVTPLRMYSGHLSDVNTVRFHPNSLYIATGSSDNSCRFWDVQRGACIRLFLGHSDAVTTLAISPDGRMLASAGLDCSIWLWDLGSSRPIKKMTGHKAPIQTLSFSAESSLLVSGSLDCTVRCWDAKSAGGERATADGMDGKRRMTGNGVDTLGAEHGSLPMGPGETSWDTDQTSDLMATFYTKRTPIVKAHHTPRNLCMVAGSFVAPSRPSQN